MLDAVAGNVLLCDQNDEAGLARLLEQHDDIVARQIREAAMAEKDPELRAALWEEYKRYKKGR